MSGLEIWRETNHLVNYNPMYDCEHEAVILYFKNSYVRVLFNAAVFERYVVMSIGHCARDIWHGGNNGRGIEGGSHHFHRVIATARDKTTCNTVNEISLNRPAPSFTNTQTHPPGLSSPHTPCRVAGKAIKRFRPDRRPKPTQQSRLHGPRLKLCHRFGNNTVFTNSSTARHSSAGVGMYAIFSCPMMLGEQHT